MYGLWIVWARKAQCICLQCSGFGHLGFVWQIVVTAAPLASFFLFFIFLSQNALWSSTKPKLPERPHSPPLPNIQWPCSKMVRFILSFTVCCLCDFYNFQALFIVHVWDAERYTCEFFLDKREGGWDGAPRWLEA